MIPSNRAALNVLTVSGLHSYTAEASSMGWQPGTWPLTFTFAEDLGNGQHFERAEYHFEGNDHDLIAVDYKQHLGCLTIRVYND